MSFQDDQERDSMSYTTYGEAYVAAKEAFESGDKETAGSILDSAKEAGLAPAFQSYKEYEAAAREAFENGDRDAAGGILDEADRLGLTPPEKPTDKPAVSQFEGAEIVKDRNYKTLKDDELWIKAAAQVYKLHNKSNPSLESMKDIEGDTIEEKLAEYGLQQMAGFNFDLVEMGIDANRLTEADDETKLGFVYMMDTYDNTDMSWKTTWDATKEMVSDPTNYLGLGAGAVAGLAAKAAGKKGFKELIKSSVKRSAIVGAYEGAIVGGADAHIRQNVRRDAGTQDEYSVGQTLTGAAIGGAAGAALASGADVVGSKISAKFRATQEAKQAEIDEKKIMANAEVASKIEAEQPTADVAKTDDVLDPEFKEGATEAAGTVELKTHKVTENADGTTTNTVKTEGEITRGVVPAVDDLYKLVTLTPNKVDEYVASLATKTLTQGEALKLGSHVNEATQQIAFNYSKLKAARLKTEDPETIKRLDKQLEKAGVAMLESKKLYDYSASHYGKGLQDTQNYFIPRNKFGVITQEAVDISSIKYYSDRLNEIEDNFEKLIVKAMNEGDQTLATKLMNAKANERAPYVKALEPFEGEGTIKALKMSERTKKTIGERANHLTHQAVELSIGGVFSMKTVAINMAWPLTKAGTYPILRFVNSPEKWNASGARAAARGVSMMKTHSAAGYLAFKDAFKYEQTFLTRDSSRILEGGIKVKGKLGAGARTFPRLLAATDAFNQELIAGNYLMHQAVDTLEARAKEFGFDSQGLQKYIDQNIEAEMAKGYQREIDAAAIQPLMEKGSAMGMDGEELNAWVAEQATRMGSDRLKRLVDEGALDEVQRALYKKEFDPSEGKQGTQYVLAAARGVERFHQKHPVVKLAGLLFTRTPMRVIEEAFRLTPALNLVLPSFRDDLAGNNGHYRQATARTELMLSNAILGYTMAKYASGEITGSKDRDWTKTAAEESSQPQMNITLDNGKKIDFSRIEPFKVPMLMAVNVLEGYERANVTGNLNEEETNKAMQNLGIAMTGITLAIRDAGLLQGITETGSVLTSGLDKTTAGDSGDAMDKIMDLIFKKSLAVIPSEISKTQKTFGDTELITTATRSQLLLSKFRPNHTTLPRKHNIFGKVRETHNPTSTWNAFLPYDYSSHYDSKGQQEIGEFIARLEQNGYGNFTSFPTETKHLDGDLREKYIMIDGRKSNVYNVILAEVARQGKALERGLLEITRNKSGLGTPDDPSPRVKAINAMRSKVWENAVGMTLSKHPELMQESLELKKQENRDKSLFPNI